MEQVTSQQCPLNLIYIRVLPGLILERTESNNLSFQIFILAF
jgi:hypothetical protein